jgi:hypothetical protein
MNPLLNAALDYMHRGFCVIPMVPGNKEPLISPIDVKWATEDEILAWWSETQDANVGIVCGLVSGIVVIDIDSLPEGQDHILEYLPHGLVAPTVRTPRPGLHLYFRYDVRLPRQHGYSDIQRNIEWDFWGKDGIVVAPPSTTPKGDYTWAVSLDDAEIQPLPSSFFSLLPLEDIEQGNGAGIEPSGKDFLSIL